MNNLLVSIIIPIYNSEKYLHKCLDSVLNQSFRNFELILVNDGSKDNSAIICVDYEKRDNRIKVIHKQNEGVSKARNIGISVSSGDYIVFIDSDDVVGKDYLKTLLAPIKNYKWDIVIGGYTVIKYNDKNEISNSDTIIPNRVGEFKTQGELFDVYLDMSEYGVINSPCSRLLSAGIIKTHNIMFNDKFKLGEDALFMIEFLQKSNSMKVINETGYLVNRTSTSSLSFSYDRNYNKKFPIQFEQLKNWKSIQIDITAKAQTNYNKLIVKMLFALITNAINAPDKETYFLERNTILKFLRNIEIQKCINDKKLIFQTKALSLRYKVMRYFPSFIFSFEFILKKIRKLRNNH